MPPHPLLNFEIWKYFQHEHNFSGVHSSNNLLKIKEWIYVINIDEYKLIGSYWIALYVNGAKGRASHNATYFDSLWYEYIQKEIEKFIGNKNITTNIYRIQTYENTRIDYTNLSRPKEYEKNIKIKLKYFQ